MGPLVKNGPMLLKIPRLYDSHTHFLATGELAAGLTLYSLKNASEIADLDLNKDHYYRGDWLVGFGWQDDQWLIKPSLEILDQLFPTKPVYLAKADGHAAWVNSEALKRLGMKAESCLLFEGDHFRAWELLPKYTEDQQKQNILAACKVYNQAGFTHIRDMSGSESLWNSLVSLQNENQLTVAIEENFPFHRMEDFETVLNLALYARQHQTNLIRSKGVKFFYDGSLGSETAYLSQPYNRLPAGPCGKPLWGAADVEFILKKTWESGVEVSVHTIGDQAAHDIVKIARQVSAQGFVGRLNLEHVQVLRPETIQLMKPLHVRCHMQPCHWLSDREWLQKKLGDLYRYAFPWESLRVAQIPVSFGCDSPVEQPSYFANKKALAESPQSRIKKFNGDLEVFHSHPDASFCSETYAVIDGDKIKEVVFQGNSIFSTGEN